MSTGSPPSSGAIPWMLLFSAFLALTLAPLDLLLNLALTSLDILGPATVNLWILAFCLLTGIIFGVSLAGHCALLLLCRVGRRDYVSTGIFATILVLVAYCVIGVAATADLTEGSLLRVSIRLLPLVIAVALVGLLSVLGAGALIDRPRLLRTLAAGTPVICASALIAVLGEIGFYRQGEWSALLGASSLALLAVILVGGLVLFGYMQRSSTPTSAAGAAFTIVACVVLASFYFLPRPQAVDAIVGTPNSETNVLLISIDTLRADRLSVYDPSATTPNIQRLADEAVVFENAYSPAPWTFPGVASFVTGLDPAVNGADCRTCQLQDDVVTLGENLLDAGYSTAAFGDNLNVSRRNLLQGMREQRFGPLSVLTGFSLGARLVIRLWPDVFRQHLTTAIITEDALGWLEKNQDKRFFLWVHYLDPHTPYTPSAELLESDATAREMVVDSTNLGRRVRTGLGLTKDQRDAVGRLYQWELDDVDRNVGRLLDRLKELGLYENTVIALTSDHGEEFWDHGSFGHGHTLFDELLRVPLIVRTPTGDAERVQRRVITTQLPRTMLDAAGVATLSRDMAPSLFASPDSGSDSDRSVLIGASLYHQERVGVMIGDLKYSRSYSGEDETLFDLKADPTERHSIGDETLLNQARESLETQLGEAIELRKQYVDDSADAVSIPADLLKSLGYL